MRHRLVFAFLLWAPLAVLAACGDSSDDGAAGAAGGPAAGSGGKAEAGKGGESGSSGQAGQAGSGGAGGAGGAGGKANPGVYHTINQWFLGEKDRKGNVKTEAWRDLGFDIDGQKSDATSTQHCKPSDGGAKTEIQDDGNNGIDNSFTRNIMANFLAPLVIYPSDEATASAGSGFNSITFDLGQVGDLPSYEGLAAQSFRVVGQRNGDSFVAPGADWSSYAWRPLQEDLDPSGSSKSKSTSASMTDRVWVGSFDSVPITLNLTGFTISLVAHHARASISLKAPGVGDEGTFGGILKATEFFEEFKKIAGYLNTSFCGNNPPLEDLAKQIRMTADILMDGTQDPARTCEGISIGFGFNTRASSLGEPTTPTPLKDSCKP